ncbi:peptide-methionine (S)-S-oxide reductase MsrA, partial [Sphingopyxis sp. LC363]|uniref:peptide-methionine (S)-S-oxide reductase MsrA n=1 Tax=Sphingopyxis sp. LC363 TaxID=1120705 RepID=UPI001F410875
PPLWFCPSPRRPRRRCGGRRQAARAPGPGRRAGGGRPPAAPGGGGGGGGSGRTGPRRRPEGLPSPPAATVDPAVKAKRATAVLAGGCFWGVEGVFSNVKGVISVESGYHGGSAATAKYERTHDGKSGHAEAVRIVYDPSQVSYGTLLRILFSVVADPTLKNRQGPDVGSQYRAAIVPMDANQRRVATAYLAQIGGGKYFAKPIVVPVEAYKRFYRAEASHQDFMRRNPRNGYIMRWDAPKLAALKRLYPDKVRATPAP